VTVDFGNSVLDTTIAKQFGDKKVVSQNNNEFVLEEAGMRVRFTRGSC